MQKMHTHDVYIYVCVMDVDVDVSILVVSQRYVGGRNGEELHILLQ